MRYFSSLVLVSLVSANLQSQSIQTFFYDSLKNKTIYLDSLPLWEVHQMAFNYHMWDRFETSELIFDYLISKDIFTLDPTDTARIGSYHTYIVLAHLRILKHRYAEAQQFLRLSDKADPPQHGVAMRAWPRSL